MEIEVWADIVCPWCYLGKRRLEVALVTVTDPEPVQVRHRSFQLDPAAAPGQAADLDSALARRYRLTASEVAAMHREMEVRAAADGLEYHLGGQLSGSTLDAHRLLQMARARGRQAELLERLYRAHFTEGRSVFAPESLEAIALEAGCDGGEVRAVLSSELHADAVQADLEQARRYGITGVPFFVIDGRLGVAGAQPAEVLRTAIAQARAMAAPVAT